MKDIPFVHLFSTPTGYYVFDVNKNEILEVEKYLYNSLKFVVYGERKDEDEIKEISDLKQRGYFSSEHRIISKHPDTDYIDNYVETHLSALVLQVTQQCNFRCDYCVYSGKYRDRTHSDRQMNFEIAKKGIDFLLAHSSDNKNLYLGFYGGEPLLNYSLIEECVEYTENVATDKKVFFNITTNASLITPEIAEFFVKHKIIVLISLDGPADIHNSSRKFANSNTGTFEIVMKNIQFIYDNYPEYYKSYVGFNAVFHGGEFNRIRDFFVNNKLFEDVAIQTSFINENYAEKENFVEDEFVAQKRYDLFLCMLYNLNKIKTNKFKLSEYDYNKIGLLNQYLFRRDFIEKIGHRSGVCIPGVQKLFLNAEGDFYPCERVSESSTVCRIGDIEHGLNNEKIKRLLNLEKYTQKECKSCWASTFCSICLSGLENNNCISRGEILNRCEGVRCATEQWMKNYCFLKKVGANLSNEQIGYPCVSSKIDLMNIIVQDSDTHIYPIDVPVCIVGESIEGMGIHNDLVWIEDYIGREKYDVYSVTKDDLITLRRKYLDFRNNNGSDRFGFIEVMNHYIHEVVKKRQTIDLLLIEVPGGIERTINGVNNEFGLWYYLINNAVSVDSFILKIPFETYDDSFVDACSNACKQIASISPDIFIMAPLKICFDDTEREHASNFLTINDGQVDQQIEKMKASDYMFNTQHKDEIDRLCHTLIALLESYSLCENGVIK